MGWGAKLHPDLLTFKRKVRKGRLKKHVLTLETICLYRHSHTDIGYTHDQPVVLELHTRFIDEAHSPSTPG